MKMKVFDNLDTLPLFHNAVITIGSFDGIHQGHQQMILSIQNEAKKIDGEAILIIFSPHPRAVLSSDTGFLEINTLEEKIANLEKMGLSNLVIAPFSKAFASISADEYIESFIFGNFNPHTIVLGYDHKFGKGRSGDIHSFKSFQSKYIFNLIEIQPQLIEDITVKGNQIGRTLGYPTANIGEIEPKKLIPKNGVYDVNVMVKEGKYKGALNMGVRPTINGLERVIEVHILDFEEDVYDEKISIEFCSFIRDERKFDSLEELKEQIRNDVNEVGNRQ
jgi:riboflavin kinase / FMN adenylyltransferase